MWVSQHFASSALSPGWGALCTCSAQWVCKAGSCSTFWSYNLMGSPLYTHYSSFLLLLKLVPGGWLRMCYCGSTGWLENLDSLPLIIHVQEKCKQWCSPIPLVLESSHSSPAFSMWFLCLACCSEAVQQPFGSLSEGKLKIQAYTQCILGMWQVQCLHTLPSWTCLH